MPLHTAALALALAAAPGDVTWFLGASGGTGDVVVMSETTFAPPAPVVGLTGVRLLPFDVLGRSTLETFLPGRARLMRDVPGAGRVVLPAGAGSLYHFERAEPALGATAKSFGFFVVDANGTARLLIERVGTGLAFDADPFLPSVAVSPDGAALLVATTVAAGGDVLDIDVTSAVAIDRTAALPPLAVAPKGLGVRDTFGAIATATAVLRFTRAPSDLAVELALPGAPTWFGGEFVFSENGAVAGTIAGTAVTSAYPFAFTQSGAAVQLAQDPAHMSSAGHLPEALGGPYFAFSGDGSVAVWRTEGLARDAWTSNVGLVPTPYEPVTSDAQFIDTLDEVGLAGAFTQVSARALLLAVGERAAPEGGLEALDFYLVESPLAGGKPAITNLTRTSGVFAEPFGKGLIDPADGAWRIPGSDRIVVLDDAGSGTRLSLLDLSNGVVAPLVPDVNELVGIASHGTDLLFSIDREIGANVFHQLVRIDALASSVDVIASLGSSVTFDRFAVRADGWVGLVVDDGGDEWVARVNLVSGARELLTMIPLSFGPTLAWTNGGRLALSGGIAGLDPLFAGWGLGVPSFLAPIAPQPGFVLPGA
jgi:hypothetical protein